MSGVEKFDYGWGEGCLGRCVGVRFLFFNGVERKKLEVENICFLYGSIKIIV